VEETPLGALLDKGLTKNCLKVLVYRERFYLIPLACDAVQEDDVVGIQLELHDRDRLKALLLLAGVPATKLERQTSQAMSVDEETEETEEQTTSRV
jgi:hypothetical protein